MRTPISNAGDAVEGIVTLVRRLQLENASSPMLVTPFGIVNAGQAAAASGENAIILVCPGGAGRDRGRYGSGCRSCGSARRSVPDVSKAARNRGGRSASHVQT